LPKLYTHLALAGAFARALPRRPATLPPDAGRAAFFLDGVRRDVGLTMESRMRGSSL